MKIVCMDCQNETYSDLESLKTNRRLVCAQCAEKSHSLEIEVSTPVALDEGFEANSIPLDATSAKSEIPAQDEEVLELSDEVFVPENADQAINDNVIFSPELETQTTLLEEEIGLDQIDNSLERTEPIISESRSSQISPDADLTCT